MQQYYAIKQDLDMVTEDVLQLKKGFTTLDYIAQTVKNTWDEQICQGEQMKRMEIQMKQMAEAIIAHDKRFDAHDKRFDRIEELLTKIMKHLKIK